jgi:FMN phosphatase YigB (HAD superfamily)
MSSPRTDFAAILFDFGDTLIDETTEVKIDDVTQTADFIPGAVSVLESLAAHYPLGLVADGRHQSYVNVLTRSSVAGLFGAVVSSEIAGADKPDPAPFLMCLSLMGVGADLRLYVVMVGNRPDGT